MPDVFVQSAHVVTAGFSRHEKWLVETDRGRLLVKVWSPDAAPAKHVHAAFVQVIVSGRGLQVPAVRVVDERAAEVDGRGVTILDYLPGQDGTAAVPALSPTDASRFFQAWGAFVGRMHAIEVPCFADRLTGDGAATYGSWDAAVRANLERLRSLNALHGTLPASDLDAATSWALEAAAHVSRDVRPAIAHRDLYLANTLVHDDTFQGVIDFELAKLWDPVYDFVKLAAWVFTDLPDGWPPFRDGYLQHGPSLPAFTTRLALATVIEVLSGLPAWRQQANTDFERTYRAMIDQSIQRPPGAVTDVLDATTALG